MLILLLFLTLIVAVADSNSSVPLLMLLLLLKIDRCCSAIDLRSTDRCCFAAAVSLLQSVSLLVVLIKLLSSIAPAVGAADRYTDVGAAIDSQFGT